MSAYATSGSRNRALRWFGGGAAVVVVVQAQVVAVIGVL